MLDGLKLDHIGIAVHSITDGAALYGALGLAIESVEVVESQKVKVAFIPVGETRFELLEPTGPESPIAKFIDRKGPGIHHLSLRVADIESTMANLARQGYKLLSEEPQPGAHGSLVCFLHPKSAGGVLLELTQPGPTAPRKGDPRD